MAMSINTNPVSINGQRNLSLATGSLASSMQRLSSGLRVNSAKDDAAGLAIAERMNAQVKGLAVASRNANDGISLAQTAEGALGKVGDVLQRMRELAVQSSNATNSQSDRDALQAELHQLREEVDRVAKTTSFNGQKLLDGSYKGAVFQVGANAGNNITVGALANTSVDSLGKTAYLAGEGEVIESIDDFASAAVEAFTGDDAEARQISITVGEDVYTVQMEKDANITSEEALGRVLAGINSKTADTGVVAFLEKSTDPDAENGLVVKLRATLRDGDTIDEPTEIAIEAMGIEVGELAVVEPEEDEDPYRGLTGVSIASQAGAWEAIQHIDAAIDKVNMSRGELGAIQTRFDKAVENIDIQNENVSAARGRIIDTDFATETANLSRTQILQQAGTAMVAQANQLSQNVLSLLR